MKKDSLIPDLDWGKIFQDDWAPCPRMHSTKQNLADKGVTVLKEWPAQKPDLNIHQANIYRTKEKSSSEES